MATVAESIVRQVVAAGEDAADAATVAAEIVDGLRAPGLRLALVFADYRFDPHTVAHATQRGLAPAPVVGGTTVGVIARGVRPERAAKNSR